MDDYLLELLKRQEAALPEEEAALELTSVQVAPIQAEAQMEEQTSKKRTADEPSMNYGNEQQALFLETAVAQQTEAVQRTKAVQETKTVRNTESWILTAMKPLRLFLTGTGNPQKTSVVWGNSAASTDSQWTYGSDPLQTYREDTDPEELSLFFERDARRYS